MRFSVRVGLTTLLVLLFINPAAGNWFEDRGSNRASAPDYVPIDLDIAKVIELPGNGVQLRVINDMIYARATLLDPVATTFIGRIDPNTGQANFVEFPLETESFFATNGDVGILQSGTQIFGVRLDDGSEAWPPIDSVLAGDAGVTFCESTQQDVVLVFVACRNIINQDTSGTLRAIEIDSGEEKWCVVLTVDEVSAECSSPPEVAGGYRSLPLAFQGLVAISDDSPGEATTIRVLNRDGNQAARWSEFYVPSLFGAIDEQELRLVADDWTTGRAVSLIFADGSLLALSPRSVISVSTENWATEWQTAMPAQTTALAPLHVSYRDQLVVMSRNSLLIGIDTLAGEQRWLAANPEPDLGEVLLSSPQGIFHVGGSNAGRLLDTATGEVINARKMPGGSSPPGAAAAGSDFIALAYGSRLYIMGEVDGQIELNLQASTRYPGFGESVTLTLETDALAAPQFVINWGDGTTSAGSHSVFEHAFKTSPSMPISVTVTAGEIQRTESLRMFVGEAEPNFLSDAFSPENQESTFFTLGLILTLLFAGFGGLRLRRKRGLLRKELAKADALVASTKDDPDLLRQILRDHRVKARRLFLDGRLDEGSTGILERHIDELLRDYRLSAVEEDMSFLPHGLFRAMQEMLRDAKVTALERTQFVRSLEAEKLLTVAQKKRVRRHVETWHREDAS